MPDPEEKFLRAIERICSHDFKPCLTACVEDCERWPVRKKPELGHPYSPYGGAQNRDVNSLQVGGAHYRALDPQPWDVIAAWNLGFFEGCVVKYVARWRAKGGVEDLNKARHYLDKLIYLNSPQSKG